MKFDQLKKSTRQIVLDAIVKYFQESQNYHCEQEGIEPYHYTKNDSDVIDYAEDGEYEIEYNQLYGTYSILNYGGTLCSGLRTVERNVR